MGDAGSSRGTRRSQLALQQGYRFKDDLYYIRFYSPGDEIAFSSYLTQRVVSEYEQHPLLCAKCVTHNLFNFWFAGKTGASTALNAVVQFPYLFLAIIGAVLCVKKGQFGQIGPMVVLIVYVVLVSVPILPQARYSVPLVPFLSILATFPLDVFRQRSSGFVPATAAVADISIEDVEPTTAEHVCSGGGKS